MTKRRLMRQLYNGLDTIKLRKLSQRVALKMAIMEIEDEN